MITHTDGMNDGRVATRLPIFVEVDADPGLTAEECGGLVAILAKELQRYRTNHPSSPVRLQLPRNDVIRDLVRQAGEMAGMEISDDPTYRKRSCHYVIGVSRTQASQELSAGDNPDPADLDPDMPLEVIHIVAAQGAAGEPAIASRASQVAPDKNSETALKRIDVFNREAAAARDRIAIAGAAGQLAEISDAELTERTARLARFFSTADALALAYQRRVRHAFTLIFSLGTLAAACYGFFLVFNLADTTLAPYLALLLIAYAVFYFAKRTNVHDRYVDYRGLAEGLRIQFYWTACGLSASAADHYPRRAGELDWIRQSLRSIVSTELGAGVNAGAAGAPNHEVVKFWIADQRRYFTATLAAARRKLKISQWLIRGIVVLGVLGAALVLLQSKISTVAPYLPDAAASLLRSLLASLEPHLDWLKLASFLSPAIATAIAGYANKMGFKYQIKHYARMAAIYTRAEAQRIRATAKSLETLAFSLGQEALQENAEWASFRRERGIEAPAGPFKKPWL